MVHLLRELLLELIEFQFSLGAFSETFILPLILFRCLSYTRFDTCIDRLDGNVDIRGSDIGIGASKDNLKTASTRQSPHKYTNDTGASAFHQSGDE
jgi:hypothetical protein